MVAMYWWRPMKMLVMLYGNWPLNVAWKSMKKVHK
ncbi:hypothetical protein BLA29_015242 [Euroglyphus maynei]|uniref:Uncharacterized protein n=1 Tax=Euroglyphus maynei TaxID=6958 RepID=A0A1Y3AR60_EURMA|nr:hypothetical protein BLA29_015242 [Euroglyphus maynei]